MSSRKTFVFSALFAGALLGACRKSSGPVVARVGGEKITQSDVMARLQETPAAYQQYRASPDSRKQFLQFLVREKVLLIEARRSGLARSSAYQDALKQFQTRMKQRLKEYEDGLLIDSYVRQLRSKELAVTDEEVRRFYEDRRAEFEKPVELQASHILLASEAEARQALERLKRGEPFEKVAREMSKDPATAVQGGRLSPFRKGALVPEFEDAASRLKNGEVSGIVKSPFGFHIIKKTGQTQLPAQSFEAAKEDIRARLEREKFDQWVTKKQQALGVQIDEQAAASLEPPPASVPSPESARP